MFFVKLADGRTLAEGEDVKNWNEVPTDSPIVAVMLSAGLGFNETLTGYDKYTVEYEAVTSMPSGASADSFGNGGTQMTAQRLIGIRDMLRVKQAARKVGQDYRGKIEKALGKSGDKFLRGVTTEHVQDQKKREDATIYEINDCEVAVITLSFNQVNTNRKDERFIRIDSAFRDGVPDESALPNMDKIKKKMRL